MKYYLIFCLITLANFAFSQQPTYKQWKEEAKNNIRLLPEYGHFTKTAGQSAADQQLIKDELRVAGTHRTASDTLISTGFKYLYGGDLKTAMYRFNQAYLLDPKNENVYWGYAAVYFNYADYDEALRQLEKGLVLNPNSSNILTDKATIYMSSYMKKHEETYLNKAIELFNRSYKIDPSNQNTLFKLSAAYYYNSDCLNAGNFIINVWRLVANKSAPVMRKH